jgi:hypothetical protein
LSEFVVEADDWFGREGHLFIYLFTYIFGRKLLATLCHTFLAGKVDGGTPVEVSGNSASPKLFKNCLPLISSQHLNSYVIFEINRDKCKKKN